MINRALAVQRALDMVGKQMQAIEKGEPAPYAYLYGGDGRVADEKYVRALVKQYGKAHYTALFKRTGKTLDDLIKHVVGKEVYDCSQGIVYWTQAPQDMNSAALIDSCSLQVPPVNGLAGSVLWKPGHVALDVGAGMCVDFCEEFVDLRMYRLRLGLFEKSGQLPWVDYRGTLD